MHRAVQGHVPQYVTCGRVGQSASSAVRDLRECDREYNTGCDRGHVRIRRGFLSSVLRWTSRRTGRRRDARGRRRIRDVTRTTGDVTADMAVYDLQPAGLGAFVSFPSAPHQPPKDSDCLRLRAVLALGALVLAYPARSASTVPGSALISRRHATHATAGAGRCRCHVRGGWQTRPLSRRDAGRCCRDESVSAVLAPRNI